MGWLRWVVGMLVLGGWCFMVGFIAGYVLYLWRR